MRREPVTTAKGLKYKTADDRKNRRSPGFSRQDFTRLDPRPFCLFQMSLPSLRESNQSPARRRPLRRRPERWCLDRPRTVAPRGARERESKTDAGMEGERDLRILRGKSRLFLRRMALEAVFSEESAQLNSTFSQFRRRKNLDLLAMQKRSTLYGNISPSRMARRVSSTRSWIPSLYMSRYLWLSTDFSERLNCFATSLTLDP